MNGSIISVVAALAWAAAPLLAQDTNPTAPLGTAGEAEGDEGIRIHWKIAFGNSATTGGVTDLDKAVAALAVEAVGPIFIPPGGGTPANGYCHHYILRVSNTPITAGEPGTILDGAIPASQSGAQEVDYEPWYHVTGLVPNTALYFSVQAVDATAHLSPVSILATAVTTSPDPSAPGAIAALTASEIQVNSAVISWTAPCDDGVDPLSGPVLSYTIRAWPLSNPQASFTSGFMTIPAPVPADPAGANPVQILTVGNLNDGESYGIGILANDGSNDSPVTTTFVTTPAYQGSSSSSPLSSAGCSSAGQPATTLLGAAVLLLALFRKA